MFFFSKNVHSYRVCSFKDDLLLNSFISLVGCLCSNFIINVTFKAKLKTMNKEVNNLIMDPSQNREKGLYSKR